MTERTAETDEGADGEVRRPGGGLPDLLYGEAETELREAVRSVLADRAAWSAVLARTETAQTWDPILWHTLAAEIGCAGLLIPEEFGGAGASYREAAVVAEETGRAVAPVPFLGSSVTATTVLLSLMAPGAGNSGGAGNGSTAGAAATAELLAALASGLETAALAVPFETMPFPPAPAANGCGLSGLGVRVGPPGSGDSDALTRLSGTVTGVADALAADVLLVFGDGVPSGLYLVRTADPEVRRTPLISLDMTRQLCEVTLSGAAGRRIAVGDQAASAIAAGLRAGAGMLAAEQLGLAERALEITVEYVKQRHQFGRPIGSFQAIKHRLADLWVAVTQARAASRYAAACLASGAEDTAVAVALAKAACSDTALKAGQEMVQLHGGIGFTWEHPAHLYLKRAKSTSIALGSADRHRAQLAVLADLPPAE